MNPGQMDYKCHTSLAALAMCTVVYGVHCARVPRWRVRQALQFKLPLLLDLDIQLILTKFKTNR